MRQSSSIDCAASSITRTSNGRSSQHSSRISRPLLESVVKTISAPSIISRRIKSQHRRDVPFGEGTNRRPVLGCRALAYSRPPRVWLSWCSSEKRARALLSRVSCSHSFTNACASILNSSSAFRKSRCALSHSSAVQGGCASRDWNCHSPSTCPAGSPCAIACTRNAHCSICCSCSAIAAAISACVTHLRRTDF